MTLGGTVYNTNAATYEAVDGSNSISLTGTAPVFTTSNDAISFVAGHLLLADGADLTVNSVGGPISIAGDITGTSDEAVTLNAGTADGNATVALGIIATEIDTITITGNDGVTLNGNISTSDDSGASVSITGDITLGASITIDTNQTTNDGSVTIGAVDANNTLTIDSGAGNVSVGVVGGTTALSGLVINVADATADNGDITIAGIGDDNPAYGVVGNVTIGNAYTDLLTFSGTNYDVDGTTVVYETEAGAGRILMTGANVSFLNNAKNITFDSGSITLSNDGTTTIGTGTGAGNIQIDGAIDGTSSQTENLVIESGTGSTTVDGAIGAVNKVGTITIGSANDGAITVSSIGVADTSGASGAVAIGNTDTTTLTLDGTIYETTSTQTYSCLLYTSDAADE